MVKGENENLFIYVLLLVCVFLVVRLVIGIYFEW